MAASLSSPSLPVQHLPPPPAFPPPPSVPPPDFPPPPSIPARDAVDQLLPLPAPDLPPPPPPPIGGAGSVIMPSGRIRPVPPGSPGGRPVSMAPGAVPPMPPNMPPNLPPIGAAGGPSSPGGMRPMSTFSPQPPRVSPSPEPRSPSFAAAQAALSSLNFGPNGAPSPNSGGDAPPTSPPSPGPDEEAKNAKVKNRLSVRMGKFKEIVKKKDPKRADSPDIGTDELPLPLPEREPSDNFDDKKKSLENQLMRKPSKPEDPDDLRKKLTDSGRALSEEESGEKKLPDRGLTGLKARFSMKRKGSMSDVTADGVSSEDDTAEEAAAPFTPPMPRPFTMHGIPMGGVALPILASPSASVASFDELPAPPEEMLPPPPPKKPETPFERRTKISNEIIETERSYISSLKRLIQVYHQPLLELCAAQAVENPNTKLTTEGINKIFSTLPSILPLNEELLNRLEVCISNWREEQTIGDVFLTIAPFLKMYADYENRYETALSIYTNFMKDQAFGNKVRELDELVDIRVEACLIMPIQRIPRYKLLLEDMVRHTPQEHPDHNLLKQALAKVDDVAVKIDKGLHEYEKQQRLLEISTQSTFQGLLAAHRRLLREGEVATAAVGGGKLQLLIFNDILVPFPKSKLSKLGASKKAIADSKEFQWPLELVWLKDDPSLDKKNQYFFDIMGPSKVYNIKVNTAEEKAQWLRELRNAMEGAKNIQQHPINKELGDRRWGVFQFRNSVYYEGDWRSGMLDGKGIMKVHGSTYEGEFGEDKKSGYGKMVFSTGEIYEGDWRDDVQNGAGTMLYPSGAKYAGGWKDGKRHAKGDMTFANGDVYKGNWAENSPNGQGQFIGVTGVQYAGGWKDGKFHGKGHLTLPAGKTYSGEWVSGKRDGIGVYKQYLKHDPSFMIEEYQGQYLNDQKHGLGTLTNADGVFEGDFVNDKREGTGTMRYADGSVYSGQWKKGVREGMGTYTAKTGYLIKYEGEWKNDRRNGKGKAAYSDNSTYDGQFRKDVLHGAGVWVNGLSGEKFEGKWRDGLREGQANIYFKDDKEKERDAATAALTSSGTESALYTGVGAPEPNSGSGIAGQPGGLAAPVVKRQPSLSGQAKDPLLSNRKLAFITAAPPPNIHVEMLME